MAIAFGPDVFALDAEVEVDRISEMIRSYLVHNKRKGADHRGVGRDRLQCGGGSLRARPRAGAGLRPPHAGVRVG